MGTLNRLLLAAALGGGRFVRDLFGLGDLMPEVVNVEDYGAVHNGTTDDAAAIQDAINALPATGGIVYFPAGVYAVGSTITIGDGSATVRSTKHGVLLKGAGVLSVMGALGNYAGYDDGAVTLLWTGGASPVISIAGPLSGWGISDIAIDGQNAASQGVKVISATHGFAERMAIVDCMDGIKLTSVIPSGGLAGVLCGTFHNVFDQIVIKVPTTFNPLQTGIFLAAAAAAAESAVFFNRFSNVYVEMSYPQTYQGEAVRLAGCDNNRFTELHISGSGAGNNYCVSFLYGLLNWPSDNRFDGVSFGTSSSGKFYNSGSPTDSPNRIVNIAVADGRPADPALANLQWGYADSDP